MLEQSVGNTPALHFETTHKIFFKSSKNMEEVKDHTVHLIVTSPPYWNIKDYGHPEQIGYRDDLPQYYQKLAKYGQSV